MDDDRIRRIALHSVGVAFALLVAAWYLLPLAGLLRRPLSPLALLVDVSGAAGLGDFASASKAGGARAILTLAAGFMAFALPALAVSRLCAPFLAKRAPSLFDPLRPLPSAFDLLSSVFVLVLISLHVLRFASSDAYFRGLSRFTFALAGASLLHSVHSAVALVRAVKRRDPVYLEYRDFARRAREEGAGLFAAVARASIRRRLVLSFAGVTISVVAVLSTALLADFRKTILATLTYNGKSLAERSASVAKANFGDLIAVEEYIENEKSKNPGSEPAFESLTYYQKRGKTERYVAEKSTDPSLLGRELPAAYAGAAQTSAFTEPDAGAYVFVSPVVFRGTEKPVGFSVVVYDRDAIFEPYFRTAVKVLLLGAVFVYLAALLVYVLGSDIALPILFLRMNVNRISSAISDMIAGRRKVSAAALEYRDVVGTRDEIKTLSAEIGHMTTVIRGVVPYISASTLRHAHREGAVSERRELAFLFTDIRGFTSMCEGLEPEEVVRIVNKYLDLQAGIILGNGGDIDKFVGDAIMAMFEGEDKELKACRTAMEIREAMAAAAEEGRARNEKTISIGIGINAGPVVFGSVGAKDRMDFTSMGDTVNLAARLEGANKEYATKTLIGEAVFEKVEDRYVCREIDLLTVKGKSRPVRVYEILREREKAGTAVRELKKRFESGLRAYRNREWDRAERDFRSLLDDYGDSTSAVFIDRIAYYRRNPPNERWDGVFSLEVK